MTEKNGVERSTATEILRRLLDERGVKHYDGTESTLWGYEDYNEFTGIYRFSADETSDGYMQVRLWRVTPEQAIAATLGSCNCSNNCTNSERTETCTADGRTKSSRNRANLIVAWNRRDDHD